METEKSCSCNQAKIEEFKQEIERLRKRDEDLWEVAKKILDPVYREFSRRMDEAKTIEEMRAAQKEKRAKRAALIKEHGLDVPPPMGRFYPNGPRYCDSFGFRCQMPGECSTCYASYCEGAKKAMAGMFD